jgi:hydrogenase maturation protease
VKRVTIGGIGNVLMGDDGVGPYFARTLDSRYEFEGDVKVVDFGTPGLDFVVHIAGLDALIIVDAVDNQTPAGTVTVYRRDTILAAPVPMRLDPHQPALKESILIADLDGNGPKDVILIGISGDTYGFNNNLTDVVRNAVEDAIQILLTELDKLDVKYTKKDSPEASSVWWEDPARLAIAGAR